MMGEKFSLYLLMMMGLLQGGITKCSQIIIRVVRLDSGESKEDGGVHYNCIRDGYWDGWMA